MNEERNDRTISDLRTLGADGPLSEAEPRAEQQSGMEEPWNPSQTIGGVETLRTQGEAGLMMLAGRYRAVRRLGEGGMGSVWLAEDTKLDGRLVAIKMLPAVLAGKKGAYRQVKQEALMAMKLSHPNIATVRAFEEDEGGAPFLVMDYIEGKGLDDILSEKGPLGEAETLKILGPVAAALDYAHSQGVVHRDVKPGNVMVRKDGTPFVLDFGIAREIQETMTQVTGKFAGGTLLYMSPEQLRGRAPKAAQDVYSFAAMTYECLAGHPPFYRGAVEDQIKNELPEELEEGMASTGLRKGIMAGLSKGPEGRPGSCMGVLEGTGGDASEKQPPGKSLPNAEEQDAGTSQTQIGVDWRWIAASLVLVGVIGVWMGVKQRLTSPDEESLLSRQDKLRIMEEARREEEEEVWRAKVTMMDSESMDRQLEELRTQEARRAEADAAAGATMPGAGMMVVAPAQGLSIPGATVTLSGNGAWLVRYDAAVFVSADRISVDGMKALKATAAALLKLPEGATVTIYGHTDGIPPPSDGSGPLPTNADFAAARAKVVQEHLTVFCKRQSRYIFETSTSAPAPYPNDTDAHRRLNRTVTLRIVPVNLTPT